MTAVAARTLPPEIVFQERNPENARLFVTSKDLLVVEGSNENARLVVVLKDLVVVEGVNARLVLKDLFVVEDVASKRVLEDLASLEMNVRGVKNIIFSTDDWYNDDDDENDGNLDFWRQNESEESEKRIFVWISLFGYLCLVSLGGERNYVYIVSKNSIITLISYIDVYKV